MACSLFGLPALGAAPSVAAAQVHNENIELDVGGVRILDGDDFTACRQSVEGIVQVRADEANQIIVAGRSQGTMTLTCTTHSGRTLNYNFTVRRRQIAAAASEVIQRDNIRLDLYFVELRETNVHQIGVGYPESIGGSQLGFNFSYDLFTEFAQATFSVGSQLLPRIDLMQSQGWARLLRQAALVTVNGQAATIDSGGEFNIAVAAGLTSRLERIRYGTSMSITPTYDPRSGLIDVAVQVSISDLTTSAGSQVPGRVVTDLQTTVNMRLGEAIVVGGLTGRGTAQSQTGLPFISQIPILGVLFGSNQRQDQATENYLFIIPTVVQAVSRSDLDQIRRALRFYEEFGGLGARGLGDIELIEPTPRGYSDR